MEKNRLGRTGLEVSHLGMGLGFFGELELHEITRGERVLQEALDGGINFFDTAACYGLSEEIVGNAISHRRQEFVLATKCGHACADYSGQHWHPRTIVHSIERSLKRMNTDYIDLIQLHSCSSEVLQNGLVIGGLLSAQKQGKVRHLGYSGDNRDALAAIESGWFDTIQTSFNILDQRARHDLLPLARDKDLGIIVKRPGADGVLSGGQHDNPYYGLYLDRAQRMGSLRELADAPDDLFELALGFVFHHDNFDTAIVGTASPSHMRDNLEWFGRRPSFSQSLLEELYRRFDVIGGDGQQLI